MRGTFAPFLRASESPIATACFLLVTVFPEPPDFSLPLFILCIAVLTLLDALGPYFFLDDFLGIKLSSIDRDSSCPERILREQDAVSFRRRVRR